MSKVAFVNTLKVPSGEASVNRMLSLAKGLVENGDEVDILSSAVHSKEYKKCNIDGVQIYNLGKSTSIMGLAHSLIKIARKIRAEHYDYVAANTGSAILIWSLFFICKIYKAKLIHGISEFPFVLMSSNRINKILAPIQIHILYKLFDAVYIMTNPLLEYCTPLLRKSCRIIQIPMTVDPSRFNITKQSDSRFGRYIAYCGNMSGNKDGVENLISAFGRVANEIPDVSLVLIGGTNTPERFDELKQMVVASGYRNIIFYGRASRDEMPSLLKNAEVLALARPSSLQSLGGFPTKLGEYLATGNPAIVTAVGDIPLFLNEENSFIVEPDNNEVFGNAIKYAILNPQEATKRGLKGLELVKTVFDYRVQSKRLHDFLNDYSQKAE
ncbi:glycosyltransferase family 4 protein [Parabacteroides sp. ZJ-118]|uniref:glycosyltransferase family 4 protein n=1 Tax=Parabacteroides sp. ZJ-118 TaxID=2709398 RepID=UPI0013EBCE29|nr:glycosyltransferase family 4 protein [Parabacteroides sp. ZJ-118]